MITISTQKHPQRSGLTHRQRKVGGLLFTSGQIPLDALTGEVVGSDITTQAEQSIKNVGEILKAAGTSFDKVIKTTCFLANMEDFASFNEVYAKYILQKSRLVPALL